MRRLVLMVTLAIGVLTAALIPAWAMDLDQARAAHVVGERPDGLVEALMPEGEAFAARINDLRMREYSRIAEKTGADIKGVKAVAGRKIIANVPDGTMILTPAGWAAK